MWERQYANYSGPELVQLGFLIAMIIGQQRWLRTMNIGHHAILPGTAASMAPGIEDANASEESMANEAYWAKSKVSRKLTG